MTKLKFLRQFLPLTLSFVLANVITTVATPSTAQTQKTNPSQTNSPSIQQQELQAIQAQIPDFPVWVYPLGTVGVKESISCNSPEDSGNCVVIDGNRPTTYLAW
jgi:hypothetical protein